MNVPRCDGFGHCALDSTIPQFKPSGFVCRDRKKGKSGTCNGKGKCSV